MFKRQSVVLQFAFRFVLLLCAIHLYGCASSETYPWPERVVAIENMKQAVPIKRIEVPYRGDNKPSGTVTLRLHVDEQGIVRRTSFIESSRHTGWDKAAIKTLSEARFVPYMVDGVAVPVTVLAPMHARP